MPNLSINTIVDANSAVNKITYIYIYIKKIIPKTPL